MLTIESFTKFNGGVFVMIVNAGNVTEHTFDTIEEAQGWVDAINAIAAR